MNIGVITNPNARKNRHDSQRIKKLQSIVGHAGVVEQTATLTALPDVVDQFALADLTYWVGDGGDGTLHWMLNSALARYTETIGEENAFVALQRPMIVPTNGGTIDFVAKRVGIEGNAESILHAIVGAERRGEPLAVELVDTLFFSGVTTEGAPFKRLGFVAALAGIGQRFFDKLYQYDHTGPLSIVKVLAQIVASFAIDRTPLKHAPWISDELKRYGGEVFQRTRARVTVDGQVLPWDEFGELSVGAININLGGVLRFFPLAQEPGVIHFQGGRLSLAEAVEAVPAMMMGRRINTAGLTEGPASRIEVEALGGDTINPVIDGEQYQGLQRLTVERGPKLRVPRIPRRRR